MLIAFILFFGGFYFVKAIPFALPVAEWYPPDAVLAVPEIISRYGYQSETHTVMTPDGYLLGLHRIPRGKGQAPGKRRAVLYVHGIFDSTASAIEFGPEKSLGFILADAGYDVWMGNMRGNSYSRAHRDIPISSPKYWDFGMDEIAANDIPAMIDYILEVTDNEQLSYVGYSMGNLVYFMMMASKTAYNDKVDVMFAEGPTVFVGNLSSIAYKAFLIAQTSFWRNRPQEMFPMDDLLRYAISSFCSLPQPRIITSAFHFLQKFVDVNEDLCVNGLFLMFGFSKRSFNRDDMKMVIGHALADTSRRVARQSHQLIHSARFQRFDYGYAENMRRYHRPIPPEYNVGNVRTPLYLLHGTEDPMSVDPDLEILKAHLPTNNQPHIIQLAGMNHMDYTFEREAPMIIVDILKKHHGGRRVSQKYFQKEEDRGQMGREKGAAAMNSQGARKGGQTQGEAVVSLGGGSGLPLWIKCLFTKTRCTIDLN